MHFLPVTNKVNLRSHAQVYLFDTCTYKCGYCWLAETGLVLDSKQMQKYREPSFIRQFAAFFNERSDENNQWLLSLTGGEPLLMPNLPMFGELLFEHGNSLAFYTALFSPERHPSFQFLMKNSYPQVDYIMASLHPEGEEHEEEFFGKVQQLKMAGHRVFVRFVGHPQRLERLDDLEEKCHDVDVTFYPTTVMTANYPRDYTDGERHRLGSHFRSLSQSMQLAGGLDTHTTSCQAGSKLIAIDMKTGDITPCITTNEPKLGNLYEAKLELCRNEPGPCFEPGVRCSCDIHTQQNMIVGAEDNQQFELMASSYVPPSHQASKVSHLPANGIQFHSGKDYVGIGNVVDDSLLYFSTAQIKANAQRRSQTATETDMTTTHNSENESIPKESKPSRLRPTQFFRKLFRRAS